MTIRALPNITPVTNPLRVNAASDHFIIRLECSPMVWWNLLNCKSWSLVVYTIPSPSITNLNFATMSKLLCDLSKIMSFGAGYYVSGNRALSHTKNCMCDKFFFITTFVFILAKINHHEVANKSTNRDWILVVI